MFERVVRLICALAFVAIAGCGTCSWNTCHSSACAKKGPKTLFEWNVCKKEEKPDEKQDGKDKDADKKETGDAKEKKENGQDKANGKDEKTNGDDDKKTESNGDKKEDKEEEEDEIKTDRPDFTESSTTVGKGRVQLETGYTFTRDRSDGTRLNSHSYPEALLRMGLFAEWFELRVGQNFASERVAGPNGLVAANSGAEDLYLGTKLALTEQKKLAPEMAIIFQMTVPTGAEAFTAHEVLPGVNWLYGWDIIKDCLSIAGSTQGNRAIADNSLTGGTHAYLELAQSVTVNYEFTKKFGMFTEWFAFFPQSSLDAAVGPEHYLNSGFTYKFTPNTQYDIRAGVGLNRHADDFFAGTGFSFRY
ncbi:MAG: transporter [Gemmataceae bacterium]